MNIHNYFRTKRGKSWKSWLRKKYVDGVKEDLTTLRKVAQDIKKIERDIKISFII